MCYHIYVVVQDISCCSWIICQYNTYQLCSTLPVRVYAHLAYRSQYLNYISHLHNIVVHVCTQVWHHYGREQRPRTYYLISANLACGVALSSSSPPHLLSHHYLPPLLAQRQNTRHNLAMFIWFRNLLDLSNAETLPVADRTG